MNYDWGVTFEHGLPFEQILANDELVSLVEFKVLKNTNQNWHYEMLKAFYDYYKKQEEIEERLYNLQVGAKYSKKVKARGQEAIEAMKLILECKDGSVHKQELDIYSNQVKIYFSQKKGEIQ